MHAYSQDIGNGLRLGVVGGVNYNYLDEGLQKFVRITSHPEFGTGDHSGATRFDGYYGIMGEYMLSKWIGAALRATMDARCVEKEPNRGTFTPRLVYINFEPDVRVNLGLPKLHPLAGRSVAVKGSATYDYTPGDMESAASPTDVDLDNVNDVACGAWAGLGYDFRLNGVDAKIGWYVTPFVEGSYLFDQKEQDFTTSETPTWNTLTARTGVQIKMPF